VAITSLFALPLAVLAFHTSAQPFQSSVHPLPAPLRAQLDGTVWHPGCPAELSQLRVLSVTHWGFDRKAHKGQLIVNAKVAAPLARVFRQLYASRFPIRHLKLSDAYGPSSSHPADGDISGSFECRQAVPSPCTGGTGTGTWSQHAYGQAVDLNPVENPYVGCGQTRDPTSRSFMDRSRQRPGMITPAVVKAFRTIGWGWGGSWTGSTKDYMHFSVTGH
jgi:D-alanyl-D-alanine carboxypeptidase